MVTFLQPREESAAPKKKTVAPSKKVKPAAEPWGPVPTDKLSIANVAPVLLPYFNNGPVFGLPGTILGDFWNRTQVTGDWGGIRTELARNGLFIDVYSTSTFQDVTSGGLKTGNSFVQNVQASLNLDTGRAGLWSGGLFHFTVQARYGSTPTDTFTVGSYRTAVYRVSPAGPFVVARYSSVGIFFCSVDHPAVRRYIG